MNLLLAFAIFTAIAWLITPYVGIKFGSVDPGSPAETAGIVAGDTIVSINGRKYDFYGSYGDGSILDQLRAHAGQTITLGVIHADGTPADVTVTLRTPEEVAANKGALGIKAGANGFEPVFLPETTGRPLGEAMQIGWSETMRWFGLIIDGLGQLGRRS